MEVPFMKYTANYFCCGAKIVCSVFHKWHFHFYLFPHTLGTLISVRVRLLILDIFSHPYFLIRDRTFIRFQSLRYLKLQKLISSSRNVCLFNQLYSFSKFSLQLLLLQSFLSTNFEFVNIMTNFIILLGLYFPPHMLIWARTLIDFA